MAHIRFHYNPNDPDSYEKEKAKATLKAFIWPFYLMGTGYGLITFIEYFSDLLRGQYNHHILLSIGMLIAMSVILFFVLTNNKLERILVAPNFIIYYYGILLLICGVIAIVNSLSPESINFRLLVVSIVWITVVLLGMIVSIKKSNKKDNDRLNSYYKKEEQKLIKEEKKEMEKVLKRLEQKRKKEQEEKKRAEQQILSQKETSSESKSVKDPTLDRIYCRKCGKLLSNDSLFCSACGTKVE